MKDDSFSVDVITRILSILADEGDMKRTVLAGRARLNYSALIRYLRLLKTLRWVESKDSSSSIGITNLGKSFHKLLEGTDGPTDISEDSLERVLGFYRGQNFVRDNEDKAPSTNIVMKSKINAESEKSCMFCGNPIKSHQGVTREIDGEKYSFDKRECAILFMRFRDAYGKEFIL